VDSAAQLKRIAARLPAPAKRAAQIALTAADPIAVRRYRRRNAVAEPIPPIELRARVGSPEISAYVASGDGYIRLMERMLREAERSMSDFEAVLDFGCGCGRVLVPLHGHWGSETAFHGCDIDEGAIAWLREHHPEIPVEVNKFRPPLPYAEGSFDLLYSISVFTHLDEDAQFDWLEEVRRVLRPGGIAMLTIHGERAFRDFTTGERVGAIGAGRIGAHSLESERFFYEPAKPSQWNALRFMDESESWGLAFHSEDYVMERWGPVFDSVRIVRGDGAQDVVLVRA
jgi:SAM-dependent methyltransferase